MDLLATAWDAFECQEYGAAEQVYRAVLGAPELTSEQRSQAQFGLAYVSAYTGRFDDARAMFEHLRREAALRQDHHAEHQMLHQVGMVERMAGRWEQARQSFEAERQLIEALGSDPLAVSVNAYEQGTVAQHFGEMQASRDWFETALLAARQTKDLVAVSCALRGLGDWAREFGTAEAEAFWQAARGAFTQAHALTAVADLDDRLAALKR